MDIRAREAVRAALNKAKICGNPIASYDTFTNVRFPYRRKRNQIEWK